MIKAIQWKKSPHPDPDVVSTLVQLLTAAQNGAVRGLVVVAINPMLEVETAQAGITDQVRKHLLAGGLLSAALEIQKIVL